MCVFFLTKFSGNSWRQEFRLSCCPAIVRRTVCKIIIIIITICITESVKKSPAFETNDFFPYSRRLCTRRWERHWPRRQCAGEYKNLCFCPNLTMDGYDKVMAPFVKRWRDKQRPYEIATNPYTKAKTLQNYELLSRRMQELQQTVTTMKTELGKLFEWVKRLRRVYSRPCQNNSRSLKRPKSQKQRTFHRVYLHVFDDYPAQIDRRALYTPVFIAPAGRSFVDSRWSDTRVIIVVKIRMRSKMCRIVFVDF